VNVNANDIACMGATPKWFQATILLPEGIATPEMAKSICLGIQKACLSIGAFLIGGHTEVTYEITRPLVIGSMLGEVSKDKLVKTAGGKPGDAIILTKGVPIEGSAIIATEKEAELLKKGIDPKLIAKAKDFIHTPGLSIIKEALLASENFEIHSMHDPTEGGLSMGLVEMALASKCGVLIKKADIPIIPEGEILCKAFNLDPLNVISSGALLIALPEKHCQSLLNLFKQNKIIASKIGTLTESQEYKIEVKGKIENLKYSEKDQITEIL
jgi:hydrogenase expression/formation protein HypE